MVLDIIIFFVFIYACVALNDLIWTFLTLGSIIIQTPLSEDTEVVTINGIDYNVTKEHDESFVNGAIWSYVWE